jgi:hypothetical protein
VQATLRRTIIAMMVRYSRYVLTRSIHDVASAVAARPGSVHQGLRPVAALKAPASSHRTSDRTCLQDLLLLRKVSNNVYLALPSARSPLVP